MKDIHLHFFGAILPGDKPSICLSICTGLCLSGYVCESVPFMCVMDWNEKNIYTFAMFQSDISS